MRKCAIDQEVLRGQCAENIQRKVRFEYYSGYNHKQHSKQFEKFTLHFSSNQLFYICESIINELSYNASQLIHKAPAPSNSMIGSSFSDQRVHKWDLANVNGISLI